MIDRVDSEQNDVPDPPTINRFAVMLLPTEEYARWAESCFDDEKKLTPDEMRGEPTVYLLPESDDDMDKLLRCHYRPMLVQGLLAWCRDETAWPPDLSYRTFRDFFQVHVTSMVVDLGAEPLERDDEG